MSWAPFVIYADLESILMPVNQRRISTHLYQNHKPCAASAILCSNVPAFNNQFYLFTGEDAVSKFFDQLIKWETDIVEHLKQNCKMWPFSRQQQMDHDNARIWCICIRKTHPFDPSIPNDRKSGTTITSQAITSEPRMTSWTVNVAYSWTFPYFPTIFANTIHTWLSPRVPALSIELAKFRLSVKT